MESALSIPPWSDRLQEALGVHWDPIADTLLGLSDFQFVEIVPSEGTFIQGFGRAYRVTGTNLDELTHVGR